MELHEVLPNGVDAVDEETRDVRHIDDYQPIMPEDPVDDDYRYAEEIDSVGEAKISTRTVQRVVGPLEIRVDGWLDKQGSHNTMLSAEDACRKLLIDFDQYTAEIEASYAAATLDQVAPEEVSAGSIIRANRQRQLDACATDAERSELRAQFAAHDAQRARGPLA